jgi:kynureninase
MTRITTMTGINNMDRARAEALDRADPVAAWREQFPARADDSIYMDGNSLGRMSHGVRDALRAGIDEWQDRLVEGWSDWIDLPGLVGDELGRLLGAGPGQVLVCDSTTVNLYKLAGAALSSQPDRPKIVADPNDFPTDRYVLAGLASARGRRLQWVASDPVLGPSLDELAATVDERTALVALSHVNYRSSARLDLMEATDLVHRQGALALWDLSHSAGAVPVGLDDAGVDFAVGCSYKYLNAGPGAPGYLYVRHALADSLRQPVWGWFGQADQFEMGPQYRPAPGVKRFLTGTPSIFGLLAVRAGVELIQDAGLDRLWAKSRALTAMLTQLVNERLVPLGARLASPDDAARRGAHVSVAHSQAWEWCTALIERGLVRPDFRTPDVIRLGPAPLYTRFVDVYDAVDRMADVLGSGLPAVLEDRPQVT